MTTIPRPPAVSADQHFHVGEKKDLDAYGMTTWVIKGFSFGRSLLKGDFVLFIKSVFFTR